MIPVVDGRVGPTRGYSVDRCITLKLDFPLALRVQPRPHLDVARDVFLCQHAPRELLAELDA